MQRSTKPYHSVACDQAIEQTLNRKSKTKGGITGYTLKPGAVQQWTLAQPERAAVLQQTEDMACINIKQRKSKYLDRTFTDKHNSDVSKVLSTINTIINRFSAKTDFDTTVCVSSGVKANTSVNSDYFSAKSIAEAKLKKYVNHLAKTQDYTISSPLCKLKTVTDNASSSKSKVKPKQQALKDS